MIEFILGLLIGILATLIAFVVTINKAKKAYEKEQPTRWEALKLELDRADAWINSKK